MNSKHYQKYNFKEPDSRLDHFKHKFESHITESREFRRAVRHCTDYRVNATDVYSHSIQYESYVAINLPRERFERLIEQQDYIQRMESDAQYGKDLQQQQHADHMVRESNSAVAKAYRNYLTLLEIARK